MMRLLFALALVGSATAQKKAGDYMLSSNGKCASGYDFMGGASVDECSFAAKTLKLQDKVASWTSSTTLPLGCAACEFLPCARVDSC
eukprot:COSAG05_NODE_1457_length_4829_cov_5.942495_1_plen_87_part_00